MDKKRKTLIIMGIVVVVVLVLIIILFSTKQNDWHYVLNNDYEIWHISSKEIVIGKREGGILTALVEDSITAFKYNDEYVITKCLNNDNEEVFYIINMNNDTIYDSYNESEYLDKIKELNIDIGNDWIKTKNR